mgnify:CR=1 FL=1
MKIFWLTNSTFLIKTSLGKKILIDPFDAYGNSTNNITADIITCSKSHNIDFGTININSHCKIINTSGTFHDKSIFIKGYSTSCDTKDGLMRGNNIIFLFEIDGYKLCHLGYLGSKLNNELINILKDSDFLFVPIGGNLVLKGNDAFKLCNLLNPKFIIPMCYRHDDNSFYYDNPKEFISLCTNINILNNSFIDTSLLQTESKNLVLFPNI